jgi:hypothetical protein
MRLALEPYGQAALDRFVGYEKPFSVLPEHSFVEKMVKPRGDADAKPFRTIGELYQTIERSMLALADPIIGNPADQVGPDLVDFPDIIRVVDLDTARAAISLVTHQGEGNQTDRDDCHFGIFMKLRNALDQEKRRNPAFSPAYPSMTNPTTDTSQAYGAPDANLIGHPTTLEAAKLFDSLYSLMLRMLGYTFTPSGDPALRRAFGQGAIIMMATVLKPLGEALAQMPATHSPGDGTAGPTFGLTRHVILPAAANTARILVTERLTELTAKAAQLSASPQAPAAFGRVEATLRRLSGLNGFSANMHSGYAIP